MTTGKSASGTDWRIRGEGQSLTVSISAQARFCCRASYVLFPLPRELLKNGNAISFAFTFQNETEEKKVEDYGTGIILKFRESDLPKDKP